MGPVIYGGHNTVIWITTMKLYKRDIFCKIAKTVCFYMLLKGVSEVRKNGLLAFFLVCFFIFINSATFVQRMG